MLERAVIQGKFQETITGVGLYIAFCLVLLATACSTTGPTKPSQSPVVTQNGAIIDYSLPGNLAPTHKVGCVAIANASNTWTPADIFPAVRVCINKGNYADAVDLFSLASSYGRFDVARVLDHSAWNALQVLQMQYMQDLTPVQKTGFNNAAEAMLQNRSDICMKLEKLGPPDYVPTYMIEHGMAAFTGTLKNGGLVQDFKPQLAWAQVLQDYAHCK